MEKIKVVRMHDSTRRNIYGKVIRKEYCYYIAVRRFWLFWLPVRFDTPLSISSILNAEKVYFSFVPYRSAAYKFRYEAEAIRVKFDILQNPNKYCR